MTSDRQREANRRNAQASTGPRTADGRARVAGNARRHCLRAASDPDLDTREVEHLAAALSHSDAQRLDQGRHAARAILRSRRIDAAKADTLSAALQRLGFDAAGSGRAPQPEDEARALSACLDEIMKLNGYARRAASQRRSALDALHSGHWGDHP